MPETGGGGGSTDLGSTFQAEIHRIPRLPTCMDQGCKGQETTFKNSSSSCMISSSIL